MTLAPRKYKLKRRSVVEYANGGATRNQPITGKLESYIDAAVNAVYGPGYRAQVFSGGQTGKRRTGTVRHNDGRAADIYVVGPNGKRLQGDDLAPLGQYWAAKKLGGVGMEMRGGGIHLDEWSKPPQGGGMAWNYAKKGGRFTPRMRQAIADGVSGKLPKLYVSSGNTENSMLPMLPAAGAPPTVGPDQIFSAAPTPTPAPTPAPTPETAQIIKPSLKPETVSNGSSVASMLPQQPQIPQRRYPDVPFLPGSVTASKTTPQQPQNPMLPQMLGNPNVEYAEPPTAVLASAPPVAPSPVAPSPVAPSPVAPSPVAPSPFARDVVQKYPKNADAGYRFQATQKALAPFTPAQMLPQTPQPQERYVPTQTDFAPDVPNQSTPVAASGFGSALGGILSSLMSAVSGGAQATAHASAQAQETWKNNLAQSMGPSPSMLAQNLRTAIPGGPDVLADPGRVNPQDALGYTSEDILAEILGGLSVKTTEEADLRKRRLGMLPQSYGGYA